MYRRSLVVVLLLVVAGCAGLVGSETGGQVDAKVVVSDSPDAEPVPFSAIDNEQLRNATQRAVSVYESNGTAETAVVPIPERKLDETKEAYRRLPGSPEEAVGRFVSYDGYTVRIRVLIYT